jgi:membrane protease YdiL (CAAX protease family)
MTGRLIAWLAFVGAFIALAYASRATGGEPAEDVLYQYDTAVAGLVQYAIVLAIVLWITRGHQRELLALRAPRSWSGAVGWSIAVIVAIYVVSGIAEPFLDPGEEQGLTPDSWQPDRAGAYAANFLVIAGVTPIVEELMFRGAGYSLLARFGQIVAILVTGVTFGLVHGLIEALVVLTAFGIGLAWLRARTDSVYPCMAVHALFNAVALIVAVTVTT